MRHFIITPLLFLFACDGSDSLTPTCGNIGPGKCYAVWNDHYQDPNLHTAFHAQYLQKQAREGLVGACKMGVPTCNDNYEVIDCKGAVYPTEEKCDSVDWDCNGKAEVQSKIPSFKWQSDEPNPCISSRGVCKWGVAVCISEEWVCDIPFYEETEISCDQMDNDCDGGVDNIEETELCFGDELWKVGNGICTAGVKVCNYGQWECRGEALPKTEICDGIDNNCNGIVDDSDEVNGRQKDVVFVLDTSGSMIDEIETVAFALSQYISQYQDSSHFRFAAVNMNGPGVEVLSDFTDSDGLLDILDSLDSDGDNQEESLGGLSDVCSVDNTLELSWGDDSDRLLFQFTDEFAQTHRNPFVTSEEVIEECLETWTLPFIWSKHTLVFEEIADTCGGQQFNLTGDWNKMLEEMNSITEQLCGL